MGVGAWGDADHKRKSDRNVDVRMPGKPVGCP